jgi:hypothetical protein
LQRLRPADIAALVQKGLLPGVQEALDSLRVIGNDAVHPGQIDLRDDIDTATSLFGLLNYIVEQMITRPKELQTIYSKLPPGALAEIQKRDGCVRPYRAKSHRFERRLPVFESP